MLRSLFAIFTAVSALLVSGPAAAAEASFVATPAISTDGKWMAWSASPDESGVSSLWLRGPDNGTGTRLTRGRDDASEPAFAPSGSTIAFRWEARKGGIFTIPVKGGSPKLLVAGAWRPRYSPDGKRIAYWTQRGAMVMDLDSRSPRNLGPDLTSGRDPVWSPDGSKILFQGCKGQNCDWWITGADGGEPAALGFGALARKAHFTGVPSPAIWQSNGTIVFTASVGERTRLWTVTLAAGARSLTGDPRRLTGSEHDQRQPAAAPDGTISYVSRTENVDVWVLPLQAGRAKAKGPLARLTTDPSIDQRPSLSADGRRIAWETSRGGNFEVRSKDLASGQEFALTNGPLREHMPAISRDGSKIAYDAHDGEKVTVLVAGFDGSNTQRLIEENVGQGSFQWTAKADALLYFYRAAPGTTGLIRLDTRQRTPLLRHPKYNLSLADARLSPDDQWIAFPVPLPGGQSRLAVARVGKLVESESEWTWLTPEGSNATQPEWSPDGRWLHFLSDRSGRMAVWAQQVSGGTARGEARLVLDFPKLSLTIEGMRPRDTGLAVGADKLAIGVSSYRSTLQTVGR